MESQVTLDGVRSEEHFTVAGQNQQESIESLKKINFFLNQNLK